MKITSVSRRFAALACASISVVGVTAVNAPTAQAATSYVNDMCSYSNHFSCFRLFYNSNSGGAVFVSNSSLNDYSGYSPNGASVVRYMFGYYSTSDGTKRIMKTRKRFTINVKPTVES
ncbi:hypothetical protein OOJ98_30105, partial [Streptomyces sp. NBC_00083]|nr:hypothetical protein [Streptomyces sp. NBC_00083]